MGDVFSFDGDPTVRAVTCASCRPDAPRPRVQHAARPGVHPPRPLARGHDHAGPERRVPVRHRAPARPASSRLVR